MFRYAEAIHIAGYIISTAALSRWPGHTDERAPFVQMLVDRTQPAHDPKRIAMPLLRDHLIGCGLESEAHKLSIHFSIPGGSTYLLGSDVDGNECDVMMLCPAVPRSVIRHFSYASMLYDQTNCIASKVDVDPYEEFDPAFSEISYLKKPTGDGWFMRFGLDWLRAMATSAEELRLSTVHSEASVPDWLIGTPSDNLGGATSCRRNRDATNAGHTQPPPPLPEIRKRRAKR